jgi:hypothetical protein
MTDPTACAEERARVRADFDGLQAASEWVLDVISTTNVAARY